ncbi:MAG: DUF3810 domain-containing protein [Adhaeribacter sp.]
MSKKYRNTIILISLPLQILVIQFLSTKPNWVEEAYTNKFYKSLSQVLRIIFGAVPVPVGQLLFYSIIAAMLFWLLRQVRQMWLKQVSLKTFFRRIGLAGIGFLSIFYFLFTLMWGLNYHRQPIQEIVNIQSRKVSTPELKTLCRELIRLTNQSRQQLTQQEKQPLILPISHDQMLQEAALGFKVISQKYPKLRYTYPAVKQVYVPQLMSFFGIGGIYFPFTGEANVNMDPPNFVLPATVCHEMAHQIGFASEDEANFVSYLACRLNPNPAFQYSGNLMAMKYAMNRLVRVDSVAFKQLERSFSPGLQQDLKKNREYWESFQNPIEVVSDGIHNLFLKANDQEEGLESYSMVVELLLAEYRKNRLKY